MSYNVEKSEAEWQEQLSAEEYAVPGPVSRPRCTPTTTSAW